MRPVTPSRTLRYGVAVATSLLALAFSLLVLPLGDRMPAPLFFGAVALSSWYGGLAPGLVSTLIASLALTYFFLPPTYSWAIAALDDILGLGAFVVVAVLISSLSEARKRAEEARLQAYDALEQRVVERTAALRKVNASLKQQMTERERAEEARSHSEARYRLLFDSHPHPMWVYDLETLRFLAVNDAAVRHYGYARDEFLRMTLADIRRPEDVPALAKNVASVTEGLDQAGTLKHRKRDGTIIDVEITSHTLMFAGRRAEVVWANDVTDRKRAEEALRASEAKFRGLFENVLEGVYQSTPDGRLLVANPALVRMLGYDSEAELLAVDLGRDVHVHPEDRERFVRTVTEKGEARNVELELRHKDGRPLVVLVNARAIHDEQGGLSYYEGTLTDITERKQLEEQFRQSQKMEAIGRLAGGIAHDFNNLLTAITGYSEFLLERLDDTDPGRRDVEEIQVAARRATALTGQLLAFSRKQVLQPRVLDLNAVVAGMDTMLRRLIGEDIDLVTVLRPALDRVRADPSQIQQVVANLAVNARDAMPRGGKLTIETASVALDDAFSREHVSVVPGRYVELAVSDNGCGMDPETQAHIFEPFFTTKEKGKGTGLGLSTVYGIVKQSGGNIWVYSEPAKGTTFKIYLPAVEEAAGHLEPTRVAREPARGWEAVLVVEDEEAVRTLAREVLRRNGYSVLEAHSGEDALRLSERHPDPIHLLLTDVVMPGMSGRELFSRLMPLRPRIRVLYISGYTDNAIVHHGVLEPGTAFLQKPFTPDALARKVREVLDA